ncbi:MAG: FtsQ-type POTRA domain-containing protein [Eubacteriales bacterium]|nr:FtsQ-type POTRA domain-containing protein [Eubacteriales bacterium]
MIKIRKKKKRRNRKLIRLLEVVALIAVIGGILVLIGLSPAFDIDKIYAGATFRYNSDALIEASGLSTGVNGFRGLGPGTGNLLALRYSGAEGRITDKLPYVKEAVVKYVIPDTIRISVLERTPLCLVKYYDTYAVVDRDGYAMDAQKIPYGLPVIKGLVLKGLEIGRALMLDNFLSFERVASMIDAINKSDLTTAFDLMDSIDFFELSGKEVHFLYDSRIVVKLDDKNEIDYTVDLLKEILNKNIRENEKGILDFTEGDDPIFTPED